MGIFNSIKVMRDIKTLKKGGHASLSYAQISPLLVNMNDARNNLSPELFEDVFLLYNEFQECKTKYDVDLNGYYTMAINIIRKFNQIAPYEKYSGGNELEISLLMDEIKSEEDKMEECIDEDTELAIDILEATLDIISDWAFEDNDLISPMHEFKNPENELIAISGGYLEVIIYGIAFCTVFNTSVDVDIDYELFEEWYWNSIYNRSQENEEVTNSLWLNLESNIRRVAESQNELFEIMKEKNVEVTIPFLWVFTIIQVCKFLFIKAYPFEGPSFFDINVDIDYTQNIVNEGYNDGEFTQNVIKIYNFMLEVLKEINKMV